MGNTEQTVLMAEIRQIKKHDEEQDKRIANLELKENVNGATILKAISELAKESRENYKSLDEKIQKMDMKIQNLDVKIDTKVQELETKIDTKIQKIDNKLDLIFEILSKRS